MPPVTTVLRHRYKLVAGVMVATLLIGMVAAVLLPLKYTAHAQVIAGQIGVSAAGVPSYAVAAQSLAQSFSRVFDGDAVQQRIKDELGTTTAAKVSVDATPVPSTSVILIEAVASTSEDAINAADAGALALTEAVARLLDVRDELELSTARFSDASSRLSSAEAALRAAEVELAASQDGADEASLAQAQQAVNDQTAAVATARAEVAAYQAAISDAARNTEAANAVQPLASARVVSDNESQRFQLLGITSLIIGAVLAMGLAYVAEVRTSLRGKRVLGAVRKGQAAGTPGPSVVEAATGGESVR
jgi:capsular polysaccharide biosynthesis protein